VWGCSLFAGIMGGLLGGVLFGALMTGMNMMEMVAMLVGAENVAVGWVVHLVIAAIFGALYALVLGPLTRSYGRAAGLGAVYGVILWVIGALLIMPLWLGMTVMVFVIGEDQLLSLVGHLVYGVVLGLVFVAASSTRVGAATDDRAQVP
jgi:uncharacterized membrane protein YagU involved in acid resistance